MKAMLILIAECFGKVIHFPLRQELAEVTVGSLPDNDIHLPYKGVSRHHFSLVGKQRAWLLRDLGSKNGTRLNGSLIKEETIKPGDVIQAGMVKFKVSVSDEKAVISLDSTKEEMEEETSTEEFGELSDPDYDGIFSFSRFILPKGMALGKSRRMLEIYHKIHALLDSDVSILLIGETGVGKEVFAQMIHLSSNRSDGPFIAVNCAAIPAELIETELFGIGEKVATDVSQRKGKMVLADNGILFLDELSAFPIGLQPKILRAIEEKVIVPVGEHKPVRVDFRVISATNQDPQESIQSGNLREDLYHRVAAVEIVIPPLRERKEDLEFLIPSMLRQMLKKENKTASGISSTLFSLLTEYPYPGNVRELQNILGSIVALAHPGEILDVHLAPGKLFQGRPEARVLEEIQPDLSGRTVNLHEKLDEVAAKMIHHALTLHEWNIAKAADYLEISNFGLRKMMKRLGIQTKKNN
jgi:transcriptional regulator with PAS, ATPase and Fis domain